MSPTRETVKRVLKFYGADAAAQFGVNPKTFAGYLKRGKFPLDLVDKIVSDPAATATATATATETQGPGEYLGGMNTTFATDPNIPVPTPNSVAELANTDAQRFEAQRSLFERVAEIERYVQGTVDFYLRQFGERLARIEHAIGQLQVDHLRHVGMPSLSRPDQGVAPDQVFTTNPNTGVAFGNALDTGVAPSKAQVDAQAGVYTQFGVQLPGSQVAGPAMPLPNQPSFGFGWNKPRPSR